MTYITQILIQMLLLLIFLFDPSELNLGSEFIILPKWTILIASMLGNIVWLWGVCLIAVTITVGVISDKDLEDVINKSIKSGPGIKGLSDLLVYTSFIISVIGMGSGFWFTGFFGICTLISLTKYRRLYWEAKSDIFL